MKILLSEAPPDYGNYVFPYVVWAFPEVGEPPRSLLSAGFLPSLPDLSRWYLCRQIRVMLPEFVPSSENRRILRKGEHLECTILERRDFEVTPERIDFCHAYAKQRWSSPPVRERIERLFASLLTSHVALFTNKAGDVEGLVTLFKDEGTWFYTNSFYGTEAQPGTGAYLMTKIIEHLSLKGEESLHLGTCYSRSALYKTQFKGMQFFDGNRWNEDIKALKHLITRQEDSSKNHLLEDPTFIETWVPEGLPALATSSLLYRIPASIP